MKDLVPKKFASCIAILALLASCQTKPTNLAPVSISSSSSLPIEEKSKIQYGERSLKAVVPEFQCEGFPDSVPQDRENPPAVLDGYNYIPRYAPVPIVYRKQLDCGGCDYEAGAYREYTYDSNYLRNESGDIIGLENKWTIYSYEQWANTRLNEDVKVIYEPCSIVAPSPSPSPTSSPTQTPLAIQATSPFSPNGDGVADTTNVSIAAPPGIWTLEVVGKGIISEGSGSTVRTWDGKIRGAIQPDGVYTLRLVQGERSVTTSVEIKTQAPLGLDVSEHAFSPNGDGVKDISRISVQATGSWSLILDGIGSIREGSGEASFEWDGRVSGARVADGAYNVRLISGASEMSKNVVIDRVRPIISSAMVKYIDYKNSGGEKPDIYYTFAVSAVDPGEGVGSNIDAGSVTEEFLNANFSMIGVSAATVDGVFIHKGKYISSLPDANKLRYKARIRDLAGNVSEAFKIEYSANETESLIFAGEPESSSAAYHLMASKPFDLKDDKVYYVKSGIKGVARYQYLTQDFGANITSGERDIFVVNAKTGKDYAKSTMTYGSGYTEYKFFWNGTEYDKKDAEGNPQIAPTGVYTVSAYRGNAFLQLVDKVDDLQPNWMLPKHRAQIVRDSFKVSDLNCVKKSDWESDFGAFIKPNIQQWAHILHRHVVMPHIHQKFDLGPLDVFGEHFPEDPTWQVQRPRLLNATPKERKQQGFREDDGWFTEASDSMPGYPNTIKARNGGIPNAQYVLNSLHKIGSQVWQKNYYSKQLKPGLVRWAPVVFHDGITVVWVGVQVDLNKSYSGPPEPISIYPFHSDDASPSKQGQRYYENNIKR